MTSEWIVAVHAVVFLNHQEKTMTSEEIAENVCTNPARIRKVMAKLKKAKLVQTKEGAAQGGYRFCLDPKAVTLAQILGAVGETVACPSWKSGDPDKNCLISSGMSHVMSGIFAEMDDACLKVLDAITIDTVSRRIFKDDTPFS